MGEVFINSSKKVFFALLLVIVSFLEVNSQIFYDYNMAVRADDGILSNVELPVPPTFPYPESDTTIKADQPFWVYFRVYNTDPIEYQNYPVIEHAFRWTIHVYRAVVYDEDISNVQVVKADGTPDDLYEIVSYIEYKNVGTAQVKLFLKNPMPAGEIASERWVKIKLQYDSIENIETKVGYHVSPSSSSYVTPDRDELYFAGLETCYAPTLNTGSVTCNNDGTYTADYYTNSDATVYASVNGGAEVDVTGTNSVTAPLGQDIQIRSVRSTDYCENTIVIPALTACPDTCEYQEFDVSQGLCGATSLSTYDVIITADSDVLSNLTFSEGVLVGNHLTEIPEGVDVTITSLAGTDCEYQQIVKAPDCANCTAAGLAIETPECTHPNQETYTVLYTLANQRINPGSITVTLDQDSIDNGVILDTVNQTVIVPTGVGFVLILDRPCSSTPQEYPFDAPPCEPFVLAIDDFNNGFVNESQSGDVSTNDILLGSSLGTITLVTSPSNGSVVLNTDGSYTYTPNTDYIGTDSFVYQLCDDSTPTNCDEATVYLEIIGIDVDNNNPPIANIDTGFTYQDTPLTGYLLTNDFDPDGDTITVTTTTVATNQGGTVTINPTTGEYVYTPPTGFVGEDTFEYTICDDGTPQLCDTATVIIQVVENPNSSINNYTVANDDAYITMVNVAVADNVLANDTDPEGDNQTTTLVSNPINGTVTLNTDGSFTYTPNTGYTGTDSFVYQACDDGAPQVCDYATAYIVIYNDNTMPSIEIEKIGIFNDENNDTYAQVGETISYSFNITNTGNVSLYNITVTDSLPGVVLEGAPISELAPGVTDDTSYSATYVITQSDLDAGNVINQATVSAEDADKNIITNLSEVQTNIIGADVGSGNDLTIFNAVTPNFDGLNDYFEIREIQNYSDNTVMIFNRWGNLVWKANGYGGVTGSDNVFRGTANVGGVFEKGDDLPTGTYFYILEIHGEKSGSVKPKYTGYLYLNR